MRPPHCRRHHPAEYRASASCAHDAASRFAAALAAIFFLHRIRRFPRRCVHPLAGRVSHTLNLLLELLLLFLRHQVM
jgi:hypothetical protein